MSTPSDGSASHLPRALALFIYGLLLDAAVETWWGGSPVRWWIVAPVTACALVTSLLWRRTSWGVKATASACIFLAAVATSAWLPGGLSAGLRVLGQQSSTVFSVLLAAAVALAATVVWRFRAVPLAARTG